MKARLLSHLPAPGASRLLVVGDLILDEYLRGAVHRISPEAPVPVLDSAACDQALGGAANVAANLRALGTHVLVCGAVGQDAAGAQLLARMQAEGLDTRGVLQVAERPTTHKLRVVSQVQHLLRIDRETKAALPAQATAQLCDFIRSHAAGVQGIVCSDYKKGVLDAALWQAIVEAAQGAGIPVVVDPKGFDYSMYRGAALLTPNLHEVEQASGLPVTRPADLDRAAANLLHATQARGLLVTCGKDGMVLYENDAKRTRTPIPAEAREVYDVTGAGDTVIAALSLAFCHGASMQESARLANTAAGLVVGKLGTATVGRDELAHACDVQQGTGASKLMARDAAAALCQRARARSQRVVFTNGCFDVLHAGHVQYLQSAKAFGDLLIVGLNTDGSMRALKGPERPLVPQAERSLILSALACVDVLVLFDEPTPGDLVDALLPDVLVKGADYHNQRVVGRETVEAGGGRVELVPLTEGQSTTGLVQTILRRYGHSG